MTKKYLSIREVVEPIIGGFWGENTESGLGNARVVRNGDVLVSGEIGPKVPERLLSEKEIQKAKLKKGDVLITMSGNVGRVARVVNELDENGNPFVASNFVKILRVKDGVLPAYLFFFLKSHQFKIEISKYTRGVAIQNLSTKIFDQEFIPNVSIKEQDKIIELLEKGEILQKKRIVADKKIETLIPSLFNKMFYGENWPTIKLSDIATVKIGPFGTQLHTSDYIVGGIPLVNPTHIIDGQIKIDSELTITENKAKELGQYIMHAGDIVLGRRGEMGRCSVVSKKEDGFLCGTGSLFISPKEKITSVFLNTLLSSSSMKRNLERNARGVTMKNLNTKIIENLKIPLPPIKLQNEFAVLIREIELQKEKQKISSIMIDNLFSSILSTL